MRTYVIRYYDWKVHGDYRWKTVSWKAESLANVRKRAIKEDLIGDNCYIGYLDGNGVLQKLGYITPRRNLESGTYYWTDETKGKLRTYRLSPKTGELLDFNKYWRYA